VLNTDQLLEFKTTKFLYSKNNLSQTYVFYFEDIGEISTYYFKKSASFFEKTNRSRKSIKFIGVKIWNSIPLTL